MRIVVAGLAATYPLGGVFWDYLQYAQGLTDLGHEVLYYEDTGAWCYDPVERTMVKSGAGAAEWLRQQLALHLPALQNHWFVEDAGGTVHCPNAAYAADVMKTAELFLNVSGANRLRLDRFPRARTVYLDSDPFYSQAYVPDARAGVAKPRSQKRLARMQSYDVALSFGENIGQPDCLIPSDLFDWRPTRQPVLVDALERHRIPRNDRKRVLTTIGTWEARRKPIVVDGTSYFGKRPEFRKFRRLPRQNPLPFELALSGKGPVAMLRANGWTFADPMQISASAESYLRYLSGSFAEWSVAKHAYVASRSGWFSGRSAVYLALGVPVIVQDTGFSRFLPTGSGIHTFSTVDEALAGIEDVAAHYERNCDAALEIAHEHFDAKTVLTRLIDEVFATP